MYANKVDSEGKGLAIENAFSYVIGVVVSNNRSVITPELELLDVFADQVNYRNVFSATIQNYTPTFVNKLAVEATVQKEGEDDILYQASNEQMQMAPNSHFNFPIPLEGDRFQSGNYVLHLKATSEGEEWEWVYPFTVDGERARALNREDVTINPSTNWWVIGSIVLLVLLLGIVLYQFIHQRKKELPNKSHEKE